MVKLGIYDEGSNSTYVGLTQTMYDNRNGDYLRLAPDDHLEIRRYSLGISHDFMIRDNLILNTTAFAYTTARNWRRQDFADNGGAGNMTGVVWGDESVPGGAVFMRNSTGNRNRQFEVAGLEPRIRYRFKTGGTDNVLDVGTRILYERAFEQRVNGASADAISGMLLNDEIRTGYAFSSWLQNRFITGERFSFTTGVRIEMLEYERHVLRSNSTDVNFRNTTYTTAIIPGAGINYNFNETIGIFAGIHRGFAPPRIKDAISSEGIDLELDPEKSWNYELGARTEFSDLLGIEFTAFYMDFSNQVIPVSESSGGAGSGYINGGRTSHRGIETELRLDITGFINIPGGLSLNLNTTFVESVFSGDRFVVQKTANDDTGNAVSVNIKGNRTPYAPGIIASGFLHYDTPHGIGFRFTGQFTGRQYADILNTGNTGEWLIAASDDPGYTYLQATASGRIGELPQFFIMNVSAWYDTVQNLRINLCVKNLLDERYIASRRPQGIRVGLPRLFTAGLSYRF
jgi:Fe(3+) dicitrate transport protein